MKLTPLLPLIVFAAITGCSTSPAETPAPAHPSADAALTPQQRIDKIQSDPNIPDGLKKIQIGTIQGQSGLKPR